MNKVDSLREAFVVANETICQLGSFERYDPTKNSKLITYASRAIRNRALNFLTNSDGRSDWGQFYYLSTRGLRQIVVSMKLKPRRNVDDYVYIHRFYRAVCHQSITSGANETRTEPNSDQLQAICDLYNSQFSQNKNFVALGALDALQITKDCIQEIRRRQQGIGSPSSLDAPIKSGNDGDSTSLFDVLDQSDEYQDKSVLEDDQLSDLADLQMGLGNIVGQEIAALTLEQQSIFTLIHGYDCKTTRIAQIYGINQSNISRRYHPAYDAIFAKCVTFCQQQVNSLDINDLSWRRDLNQWIKDYLNSFYRSKLSQLLEYRLNSHLQEEKETLHKFHDLTEYISVKGEELVIIGVDLVINYLQQEFQITRSCKSIIPDIADFIKSWMSDRPNN